MNKLEQMIAAAKAMPKATKPAPLPATWQRPDGTWAHAKDAAGRFASRLDAETDLRFAMEWEVA